MSGLAVFAMQRLSGRNHGVRRTVLSLILALLLFGLLEFLVFRPSLYGRFVEPRSYAGNLEMLILREDALPAPDSRPRMTIVGDSRIAECFSETTADSLAGDRWRFVNAALPGSTPRLWYYILREIDPEKDRNSLVVVPLQDYPDIDPSENLANRMLDIRVAILHLGLSDLPNLLPSFDDWGSRFRVARAVLLKGGLLKEDVQDFILDPSRRFSRIELYRQGWPHWRHTYTGKEGSLEGVRYDPVSGEFTFPPSLSEQQRAQLVRSVKEPPQRGSMRSYRQRWLTALVDYYRGTSTRVVFLRMPRGPVVASYRKQPQKTGVVTDLARRPHVRMLPEDLFDELEQPRYFFDTLHLNSRGRERFTRILVRALGMTREFGSADELSPGDGKRER